MGELSGSYAEHAKSGCHGIFRKADANPSIFFQDIRIVVVVFRVDDNVDDLVLTVRQKL